MDASSKPTRSPGSTQGPGGSSSSPPGSGGSGGASSSPLETVRRVAALARLDLAEEEEEALARQFATILEQFQVLARLDVTGVEAMVGGSRARDVVRDDEPQPSLPLDEVLKNAPAREGPFYSVPKTVGGDL